MRWNAGIFRTDISNDIIEEASQTTGQGYFQNDGDTRRQGVEAGLTLNTKRSQTFINYSYVDATFESALTLSSPNNPQAVNGVIQVQPGNTIPNIPKQRLKMGTDYLITPGWSGGAYWTLVSSQVFVGDEANLNSPVPGYGVVGLHSQYQIKKWLTAFGYIENLFDRHYPVTGTYTNATGIQGKSALPGTNILQTESFTPAPPFGAWIGLRAQI